MRKLRKKNLQARRIELSRCNFCQSGNVEPVVEVTTGIQDKEGIERTHTSIVACLRCGRVSVFRSKSFDARGNTFLPEVPVTDAGPVLGSSQEIEEVTEARELREVSNRVTEQFQKDEEELREQTELKAGDRARHNIAGSTATGEFWTGEIITIGVDKARCISDEGKTTVIKPLKYLEKIPKEVDVNVSEEPALDSAPVIDENKTDSGPRSVSDSVIKQFERDEKELQSEKKDEEVSDSGPWRKDPVTEQQHNEGEKERLRADKISNEKKEGDKNATSGNESGLLQQVPVPAKAGKESGKGKV